MGASSTARAARCDRSLRAMSSVPHRPLTAAQSQPDRVDRAAPQRLLGARTSGVDVGDRSAATSRQSRPLSGQPTLRPELELGRIPATHRGALTPIEHGTPNPTASPPPASGPHGAQHHSIVRGAVAAAHQTSPEPVSSRSPTLRCSLPERATERVAEHLPNTHRNGVRTGCSGGSSPHLPDFPYPHTDQLPNPKTPAEEAPSQ